MSFFSWINSLAAPSMHPCNLCGGTPDVTEEEWGVSATCIRCGRFSNGDTQDEVISQWNEDNPDETFKRNKNNNSGDYIY